MTSKHATPAAGPRPRLRLLPSAGTAASSGHQTPALPAAADARDGSERFQVLGIDVHAFALDEAVRLLLDAPRLGRRMRVHFAAVHTFVEASKDTALRQSLSEADVVAPDGMPIVWLGRLAGRRPQRVCGPDAMLALLDRSREHGYRHFFYGGSPAVAAALTGAMEQRFPGLEVVGSYSPPFRPLTPDEEMDVARMINEAAPDYVWVGLGSPKQDRWLATFRPLLDASVLLAVGAAFDFHAGRLRRAPGWAQRRGLEWLFRLASEPRRLAWRYTAMSFRFAQLLIADRFRRSEART